MTPIFVLMSPHRAPLEKAANRFCRDFAHMFPNAANQLELKQRWDEGMDGRSYAYAWELRTSSRSEQFIALLQGYLASMLGEVGFEPIA